MKVAKQGQPQWRWRFNSCSKCHKMTFDHQLWCSGLKRDGTYSLWLVVGSWDHAILLYTFNSGSNAYCCIMASIVLYLTSWKNTLIFSRWQASSPNGNLLNHTKKSFLWNETKIKKMWSSLLLNNAAKALTQFLFCFCFRLASVTQIPLLLPCLQNSWLWLLIFSPKKNMPWI